MAAPAMVPELRYPNALPRASSETVVRTMAWTLGINAAANVAWATRAASRAGNSGYQRRGRPRQR